MGNINYPGYIGFECNPINAINLTLKYVGDKVKRCIVKVGDMVSIGYNDNKNGITDYSTILGRVKNIYPVSANVRAYSPKGGHLLNSPGPHSYILEVDASEGFNSVVESILVSNIRDIAVASVDGSYTGNTDVVLTELPEVNDSNIAFYVGKVFLLKNDYETVDNSYLKGLYSYTDGWRSIVSGSLISTVDYDDDGSTVIRAILDDHVKLLGKNIMDESLFSIIVNADTMHVGQSSLPADDESIRLFRHGSLFTYAGRLTGITLETPPTTVTGDVTVTTNPDEYISVEMASIINPDNAPLVESAINETKVYDTVNDKYVSVYHVVTPDGSIVLSYPKSSAVGIKDISLIGTYFR